MKFLIIFLLFICLQTKKTKNNYQEAIQLWQLKVPKQAKFSLKQFSNDNQMCGETQCELFYFVSQNSDIAKQKDRNRTVLLISGLRGDDLIGPNILLNAYGKLKAARIIYFPLPNPSGFNQKTTLTFPGFINVENDFPIGQIQSCNNTAATKSLHYLFQKYAIDLTIYLHDGKPSISYSWGSKYQFQSPKVDDFGIYADITDMVKYQNIKQKQLQQLQSGSLYELNQNENVHHFIDWAYGASKYPSIVSKKCSGNATVPYSKQIMNGLALSLGIRKIPEVNNSPTFFEKQIENSIEILEKIIQITNPKVKIQLRSKNILLSLQGCKSGSVASLKIISEQGKPVFERIGDTIVYGDVMYGAPQPKIISLPSGTVINTSLNYELSFVCDNGWVNIGTTAFSQVRTFNQNGQIIFPKVSEPQKQTKLIPQAKNQKEVQLEDSDQQRKNYKIVVLAILLAAGIGWMIYGLWQSCRIQRQQRIINFNEKFENVEIVEDLESFSHNQTDSVTPQLSEAKLSQIDADKTHLNSTQ